MKYKLSILMPGVRNNLWVKICEDIKKACKNYTYEIIFCSPFRLPTELEKIFNIKYIKDFGSPSRAFQIASLLAEGELLMWITDDAFVCEDSIDKAIQLLETKDINKDIIAMRYAEGQNHSAVGHPDEYYVARYHADLRLPGVKEGWMIPCVMLLNTKYYQFLGGIDCRFEHLNFNVHDLGFRAQESGSKVYLSPTLVLNCDWDPNRNMYNSNVIAAYHYNDKPLMNSLYNQDLTTLTIDYSNWKNCDAVWARKNYEVTYG